MIIVGLYSFLWGKRNERKASALPDSQVQPEPAKTNDEPAATGSQLTAVDQFTITEVALIDAEGSGDKHRRKSLGISGFCFK